MTQTSEDVASRSYAVPIRGCVVGMNYFDGFEHEMVSPTNSDFDWLGTAMPPETIYGPVQAVNPLRVLLPHYGELTQCYIDIKMTVASGDGDLTMKIATGKLRANSIVAETEYTQSYIDTVWRRISGSNAPLIVTGGVIEASTIDLMPVLPKYGDSNYDRDIFVLLVCFNRKPLTSSPYKFNIFNLHQSSTGVL